MENISKAFRTTREMIGLVASEKDRLMKEGFRGVPQHLLNALVDLTKAQVSLEQALEQRVRDLAIEAQTMRRREEHEGS